ncbi:hypothetical protein HMPREF9069_00223 [Atopobium sp. oral taxon 810 str. F0209]|nr:hypothetical protein HMPREF9069_00223 [Atopobium sp. oral taxon 810 str. F0209]
MAFDIFSETERGVWQAKPCWLKRFVAFGIWHETGCVGISCEMRCSFCWLRCAATRRVDSADMCFSRTSCSKMLQPEVATAGFLPACFAQVRS